MEFVKFINGPPFWRGFIIISMNNEALEQEIATKIKRLRKQADISQEEMAEIIGYNSKVVSAIEEGQRSLGLKTLIKWADAVNKKLIVDFNSRLTIKSFLDEIEQINDLMYPIFERTKVAKLIGVKWDTLVRRMGSKSISPNDMAVIVDFYAEQIGREKADRMKYILTEKYELIERLTTERLKGMGIPFTELSKYSNINYNIIMNVVNGRELWGVANLKKISDYLEHLSTLKFLDNERNIA